MNAPLERRYRAALDLYPAAWREANADAMLGTLLDEAEATGRDRPSLGQTLNLMVFAARERARSSMPAAVRDRAAAIAWGLGAAISTVMFVVVEWSPRPAGDPRQLAADSGFGPFLSASVVILALWTLSFVVAIAGAGAVARWMLAATIPLSLALVLVDGQSWSALRPPSASLLFLAVLALIAMQGAPAASGRGRAWLLVVAIGSTAFVLPGAVEFASREVADDGWMSRLVWTETTRPIPIICALLGAAVVAVIARRLAWAAAALVVSVPSLLFLMVLVVQSGGVVVLGVSLLVVLAVVALVRHSGYRVVVQRRG